MTIEYFKQLTKIPRCSGNSKPFVEFISKFAKKRDYTVEVDNANNILCKKSNTSSLCLQSHYDIVCVNDNRVELLQENSYFKAKNSTLGADNGVGCAMMMSIMDRGDNVELLFTSDEEIGLIGANRLKIALNSKFMLNLDTEEQGKVYIGCAGGVDIKAKQRLSLIPSNQAYFYELTLEGLEGGHSGVDIDKEIPNAIKEGIKLLPLDAKIGYIEGGQRVNSIPTSTTIRFSSDKKIDNKYIKTIEKIDIFDIDLIKILHNFNNGVLKYNNQLNIVHTSQNLAIISTKENLLSIEVSIRSMDNNDLSIEQTRTMEYFQNFKFDVNYHDKYPSWKPKINNFTTKVKEIYNKFDNNVDFKAIHAGLECAVFASKYPNIQITSIGPNIYNPHSLNEKVDINSIIQVDNIVKEISTLLS